MRKRKQQVMEKTLTLSRSSKRSSTSGGGYFDLIPVDLTIKIMSKLSGKSMAQCRCVCKLWSSIIRRQNHNQLFPIKSAVDPLRLLIAVEVGEKLYFYSAPQIGKQHDDSFTVTATFHHAFSRSTLISKVCSHVHGLVCHERKEDNHIVAVVSNPIIGESVTSPKLLTYGNNAKTFLGYDPINKQFKVLCLTWSQRGRLEHQVLTLETDHEKQTLWRKIPCCIPYHNPVGDGICIDGILYYYTSVNKAMILSFNVTSEKFSFVTGRPGTASSDLINHKGKLCAGAVNEYDDGLVLWVLKDAEEHKWSKHILLTPFQLQTVYSMSEFVAAVTDRGEIVLYADSAEEDTFYISYYNLQMHTKVRVGIIIQGLKVLKWSRFHIFPNYVEYVKLIM